MMLASCAWVSDKAIIPALAAEPYHSDQIGNAAPPFEAAFLGDRTPQFGIAISGGGVRSSLYMFGAFKALYDAGKLDEADYISSVSGGSYLSYWLYTTQAAAWEQGLTSEKFGRPQFHDAIFDEILCDRVANANFVSFRRMARNATRARRLYSSRIGYVFGQADGGEQSPDGDRFLHELAPLIRQGGWPLPILNGTMYDPEGGGWHEGLVELTPLGSRLGKDANPWSEDRKLEMRVATAASGAAWATLLHRGVLATPAREVRVHDGGGSENLGAIALIRRGVPRILAIDAEFDADYGFGAYDNMKKRLPYWGATIEIPEIEGHLATGAKRSTDQSHFSGLVYTGLRDRSRNRVLEFDYVKMSLPPELKTRLDNARETAAQEPLYDSFMEASTYGDDEQIQCQTASTGDDREAFFTYAVATYENFWNNTKRVRKLGISSFPQYSTADQSFYSDQAMAFIGLGYLQMRDYLTASE